MKLTWKERIFSLKDCDATHTQLCVLGIRVKLRHPLRDEKLYHHLPIEPRKIVLHSVFGGYQCNPKYIVEELRRRGTECDFVWVVGLNILHHIKEFPSDVRLVMRGTQEALRELATARIWIENERKVSETRAGLRKRPGQVYIATWHGSLGIKRTGGQRGDLSQRARQLAAIDDAQVDYLISNSAYTTAFYKQMFFSKNAQIEELGCPRNDVFFLPRAEQDAVRRKVCKILGIPSEKKLLLWAPTFRQDGNVSALTLDTARAADALAQRFGGEWMPVARLHSYIVRQNGTDIVQNCVNATSYPDMQELLVAVDAVITDYSSCIYDFLLTRRPGFIYAPDRREYEAGRGLCYPLSETPFPIAEDNEQLAQLIRDFDETAYRARVEAFLKGKGSIDDGHASARVADFIERILNSPPQDEQHGNSEQRH